MTLYRNIFFRPDRCMLCLSCVLACQMNSLALSDARKIQRGRRPSQRISVTFDQGTPWIWKCQHCTWAPCVEACVSGSLCREDGKEGVVHHKETCVGCGSCLLACPYEALHYDEEEQRVDKCNLCMEETVPPCVRACQSKALVFEETTPFLWGRRKRFAQEVRMLREGD